MRLGLIMIFLGLMMVLLSTVFRKQGVPARLGAPIWHAGTYLKRSGVILWIGGACTIAIGLALALLRIVR
jgi:hypothetical protein